MTTKTTAAKKAFSVNTAMLQTAVELRRQVIHSVLAEITKEAATLKRGGAKTEFTFGGIQYRVPSVDTLVAAMLPLAKLLNSLNTQLQFVPAELGVITAQVGGKVGQRRYVLHSGKTVWAVTAFELTQPAQSSPKPIAKPISNMEKPVPKPAAKPVPKPAAKPVPKPAAKPVPAAPAAPEVKTA